LTVDDESIGAADGNDGGNGWVETAIADKNYFELHIRKRLTEDRGVSKQNVSLAVPHASP